MKNGAAGLPVTQQYLLCALQENGTLPMIGQERMLSLVAGGVLELLLEETLALEGKKLRVAASLPAEKEYLRPVWGFVEKKQPVRFEKAVQFEQKEQRLTRRYSRQASVQRIEQIQRLRQQGRTIPEIRELLRAQDDGE